MKEKNSHEITLLLIENTDLGKGWWNNAPKPEHESDKKQKHYFQK